MVQRVPSKQQGLLSPFCILEHATSILLLRVAGFLVERIQRSHSRRAFTVRYFHWFKRPSSITASIISFGISEDFKCLYYDSRRRIDISSLGFTPDIILEAQTRYYWKVQVWGEDGEEGESEVSWFETGLKDWTTGKWITSPFLKEQHPLFFKRDERMGWTGDAQAFSATAVRYLGKT